MGDDTRDQTSTPQDDQVDMDHLVNEQPPAAQDPASPQLQDEEAEKQTVAEKGAGVEEEPAADDILATDNQTAQEQLPGSNNQS
jgi:hypothetical protein